VHQVGFIYKNEITHLYTVQIWTINIDLECNEFQEYVDECNFLTALLFSYIVQQMLC